MVLTSFPLLLSTWVKGWLMYFGTPSLCNTQKQVVNNWWCVLLCIYQQLAPTTRPSCKANWWYVCACGPNCYLGLVHVHPTDCVGLILLIVKSRQNILDEQGDAAHLLVGIDWAVRNTPETVHSMAVLWRSLSAFIAWGFALYPSNNIITLPIIVLTTCINK